MDWVLFLSDYSVPYVTRGPNTKRGEVSIKCPWCGEDDPSEHLGINLTIERWGCHRNQTHRGKNPLRLVRALLGCSTGQAKLVIKQYDAPDPETLGDALAALLGEGPAEKPPDTDWEQAWQREDFRQIKQDGLTGKFWRYLKHRGFDGPGRLVKRYGLRCALIGRYQNRIIIPITHDGLLVGWTSRAIVNPVTAPRYLSTGEEIKKVIFNEDELLSGGEVLFVTEGPFDALKVDYYGEEFGARATCVFGTSIVLEQYAIIKRISRRFKRVVLLLDPDAVESSFISSDYLPGATFGVLPDGVKDPGDLTHKQVLNLLDATID